MLAKDLQYDRMESVKEKGNWIIQDSRLRKKELKNRSSEVFQLTSSSCTVNSVNLA